MTQTQHTASSKETEGSSCIDAYGGQKVTMFYETFQNILSLFHIMYQNDVKLVSLKGCLKTQKELNSAA